MSKLLRGIGDSITAVRDSFSPLKPSSEEPTAHMEATLDTDTRKRKIDPYDDIPEGQGSIQVAHGDDPAQTTPDSHKSRRTTSNTDLFAPGTIPPSANRVKRRGGRPSITPSEAAKTVDPRVDAPANLERALAPDAARLQPAADHDPTSVVAAVPEADMGGGDDAELFSPPIKAKPQAASSSPTKAPPIPETEPETSAGPEEAEEAEEEEDARQEEEGDVAEVHALLDHKVLEDKSVDLLVHWQGEPTEEATWEPETEIQEGAGDLLYNYWKKAGGRTQTLFKTQAEVYHVFRILNHEKKPRSGFKMEVQWVGYPATKSNTSWEPEIKLRQIAPELLEEYWERVGGRSDFLSKRGRTKKN